MALAVCGLSVHEVPPLIGLTIALVTSICKNAVFSSCTLLLLMYSWCLVSCVCTASYSYNTTGMGHLDKSGMFIEFLLDHVTFVPNAFPALVPICIAGYHMTSCP